MSVGEAPRVRPLRRGDPEQLGPYRIVGRLGEGGMGTVFYAENGDGQPVALKVIRPEIADDDDFRRRFQKEVDRARQVPPFCTAEVLDADTDHDPPYLVVEYVDGPTLSNVVQERGPLSPANQHGLAVGMAVALTAIHGAGVIHRDLKPSNVLLAPGSPKVIDFGIARAVVGHDPQTHTDQMMGTVGYMAPERLEPGRVLTPAADIFAWGAVVAFAATGRTPFRAEEPAAVALKIVSEEPDLEGLTGQLRDLVELALAKDPAARPTARQLVDRLLAGEGFASAATDRPAAFAEQPEVLAAAGIVPATQPVPGAADTAVQPSSNAQTVTLPSVGRVPVSPTPVVPRQPVRAGGGPASRGPARRPAAAGSSRRGNQALVTILAVCVLLLGGTVVGILTGKIPLPDQAASHTGPTAGAVAPPASAGVLTTPPATTAPPTSVVPTSAVPSSPAPPTGRQDTPSLAPDAKVAIKDALSAPGRWINSTHSTYDASCTLKGRLTVTLNYPNLGSYRCQGPSTTFTDFTVAVDVSIPDANSCAGVWYRFNNPAGYVLQVCKERYVLQTHINSTRKTLTPYYYVKPVADGETIHVTIRADGDTFFFYQGDDLLGEFTDQTFAGGRIILGVIVPSSASVPPVTTTFSDITIWK
ncbi:serine/threonine protein kinase [Luedemannella helvata]|uniref:Protein kinase domain-containing protein n=1 Tax=Luedemannella helvata TaxID=349315 RepID=A0ABP4WSU3_9ACTN